MNRQEVQALVKTQYKNGELDTIQRQSAKVYKYCKSKGMSHLGAINEVLDMGVEYNDLLAGILTLGIDEGVQF